jgi:ubiquinone/menaquinone biosynthesis C-methylase UbiE
MTVLVVGADATVVAARLEDLGDGDLFVLEPSAGLLEEVEDEIADPRVWFMIGDAEVIPLPDASVDEILGAEPSPETARVTR